MTLPNKITLTRFVLTAIVIALLLIEAIPNRFTLAVILFVLASATDFADGIIARRTHTTSGLGAFMDPLADKLLVLLVFVSLVMMQIFPLWLFILMLARDLLSDAYRNFAASQRIVVGDNPAGKVKTTLQMISLSFALLVLMFRFERVEVISNTSSLFLLHTANVLMIISLIIGIVGTTQFITKHSKIISLNE